MWSSCRVKVFSNSNQASGSHISYPKIISVGGVALYLSTWRFLRTADPFLYPVLILPSCAFRKPDNIKLQVALRWRLCAAGSRSREKNEIFFLSKLTLDNRNIIKAYSYKTLFFLKIDLVNCGVYNRWIN